MKRSRSSEMSASSRENSRAVPSSSSHHSSSQEAPCSAETAHPTSASNSSSENNKSSHRPQEVCGVRKESGICSNNNSSSGTLPDIEKSPLRSSEMHATCVDKDERQYRAGGRGFGDDHILFSSSGKSPQEGGPAITSGREGREVGGEEGERTDPWWSQYGDTGTSQQNSKSDNNNANGPNAAEHKNKCQKGEKIKQAGSSSLPPLEKPPVMIFENLYEIVGVHHASTQAELRSAMKRSALKFHPDRNVGLGPREEEEMKNKFQKVNEAFAVLLDEKKRSAHDTRLGLNFNRKLENFMEKMSAHLTSTTLSEGNIGTYEKEEQSIDYFAAAAETHQNNCDDDDDDDDFEP